MFLILYPEQANKRKLEEVARPRRGSVNLKGLNWKVNCFLLLLAPLEGTQRLCFLSRFSAKDTVFSIRLTLLRSSFQAAPIAHTEQGFLCVLVGIQIHILVRGLAETVVVNGINSYAMDSTW